MTGIIRGCFSVALVLALAGTTGCSSTQTYKMVGTEEAPGADAKLEVTPAGHGNQDVRLDVQNLLPPERAKKGARRYAVWVQHDKRPAVHLGNLSYDDKGRSGSLEAQTPYKSFRLWVTAEKSDHPEAPSKDVVVEQDAAVK